jgi:O-antigen ligase
VTNPNLPAPAGLGGGGLWPAHVPRPAAPAPAPTPPLSSGPPGARPPAEAIAGVQEINSSRWPWTGVEFTLVYIGMLGFVFTSTTYWLPIGDVSMTIALVGLMIQKERFRMPGLLVGLGIFTLWAIVGYTMTSDPGLVLERLQIVGKLWLIGLVAANALRTRAQLRFFMVFWLACFAFFPVRGALFNYHLYGETIFGRAKWNMIFSNPNDLAAFCLLQLSMALALLGLERRGPSRWGTLAGLVVIPYLILITKSRGAFIAFSAFLLLVIAGHKKRFRAIFVTALLATVVVSIAPPEVLDRVIDLRKIKSTEDVAAADEEGSAFQRYEIWKVARTMIRENPIVGVGLGAYPAEHSRIARRSTFHPTARGRRDTHSLYLNLTAETGFVGVTIYLISYLGTLIWTEGIRRRAKKVLPHTARSIFILEAGVIAYFLAGVFGSIAHVTFFVLHLIVTWCFADIVQREMAAARRGVSPGGTQMLSGGGRAAPV